MHRTSILTIGWLPLLGLTLGCGSSTSNDVVLEEPGACEITQEPNVDPLIRQNPDLMLGKTWNLERLLYNGNVIALPSATLPTLVIKNLSSDIDGIRNEFSGETGCNTWSGKFTALYPHCFALTRLNKGGKTCGDEITTFESAYLAAFKQVTSYEVGTTYLTLSDRKSTDIVFRRALGGTCRAEKAQGPLLCSDSPRRAIFWDYVGSPSAKQATTIPASGCRERAPGSTDFQGGTDCQGSAQVRIVNGIPTLTFVDGSTLSYSIEGASKPITPPVLADATMVWVSYQILQIHPSNLSPTSLYGQMQIRQNAGGPLLWLGKQGNSSVSGDDTLISELLGTVATAASHCDFDFNQLCWTVNRTLYNHVLPTMPVQTIPHAQNTQVTTSTGKFEVFWVESKDTEIDHSGF
jgi:hypothetical protein